MTFKSVITKLDNRILIDARHLPPALGATVSRAGCLRRKHLVFLPDQEQNGDSKPASIDQHEAV
jgi:hypothetical protein